MKYLSVCSGIEAASVAWEPIGRGTASAWEPVGFAEIECFPSEVLTHRFGATRPLRLPGYGKTEHAPKLRDIRRSYRRYRDMPSGDKLPNFGDFTQITAVDAGKFDLLVGGTPCTDFSVAGRRAGFEGARGSLTYEYVRLLRRTMPGWFVWENVPGVLQGNMRSGFAVFVWQLCQLGYSVEWRIVDAQYCRVDGFPGAVPQRRRRLFVVGYLGKGYGQPVLLEPRSSLGDNPPRRKTAAGTALDAEDGIAGSSRSGLAASHWDGSGVHPNLTQAGKCGGVGLSDQEVFSQRGAYLVMASGQANAEMQSDFSPTLNCDHEQPIIAIAGNIIGRRPDNGGNGTGYDASGACYTFTGSDRHAVCFNVNTPAKDAAIAFEPRYYTRGKGGAKGSDIVGTLSALSSGTSDAAAHVAAGSVIRRLVPVEAERLMGFPDHWTRIPWRGRPEEQCPDSPRYKALGNSMAVNVMRWIGRRIQAALDRAK